MTGTWLYWKRGRPRPEDDDEEDIEVGLDRRIEVAAVRARMGGCDHQQKRTRGSKVLRTETMRKCWARDEARLRARFRHEREAEVELGQSRR